MLYMIRRFFLKVWLRKRKGNGAQLYLKKRTGHSRVGAEEKWKRIRVAGTGTGSGNAGGVNGGRRRGGRSSGMGGMEWVWTKLSIYIAEVAEHMRRRIEVNGFLHFSRHLSLPNCSSIMHAD